MSQDPNKKTLRQFQCRDYLWSAYEKMSADLSCSVDYLINEAMRHYAKSRNYGGPGIQSGTQTGAIPMQAIQASVLPPSPAVTGPGAGPIGRQAVSAGSAPLQHVQEAIPGAAHVSRFATQVAPPAFAPSVPPLSAPNYTQQGPAANPMSARPSYVPPTYSAPQPGAPPVGAGQPTHHAPAYGAPPSQFGPPRVASSASTIGLLQGAPGSAPPPLPGSIHPAPSAEPAAGTLSVIYNGSKISVNKGEFVIGRGSRSADLVIQDGNISRRHAAIVLQDGAYYIKDLGSTNGVEFQGKRVDSKQIHEGDVVKLCDHVLQFTYR